MTTASHQKYTICIAGHRFLTETQGGVELQTRYIGEALAQSGWNVTYLAPSLEGKEGHDQISDNIHVCWYPNFSYAFTIPTTLIKNRLDTIRPSIFYQRGRGQLLESKIILNYALTKSIPYVFALSSDMDLDGLYATKANLKSWRPLWKRLVFLPYFLWLDRSRKKVFEQADYIVVQHEDQMQAVNEKFARQGVLLRTLHPEVNGGVHKSKQKIVLWVNNYRPWKQGRHFVHLARRCSDLEAYFVMVHGKTKTEYIEPVLEQAQGVRNLTILGEVPLREVEELMARASLFVNTSLNEEGFPNTFVQSWLRETPTVSLNVDPGGVLNRENIGVCSRSFEQLVEDITELVKNDRRRLDMGKRARRYAERVHGFSHNCEKMVEFFDKVVTETFD